MSYYPSSGRTRGFTLIELLTVVAIIGVLALITFLGLGRIRARADQTTCASNMRSMGQTILMYANENRGRIPPIDDIKDENGNYIVASSWSNVVVTYLGGTPSTKMELTRNIMRCPPMRRTVLEATNTGSESQLNSIHQLRNFGLNYFLGPSILQPNNWRTVASIGNPSRTIMLSESVMQTSFTCTPQIVPGTIIQSTRGPDGVLKKGVHGDSNNIVWCDGHVSSWEDISRAGKAPYTVGSTGDIWRGL